MQLLPRCIVTLLRQKKHPYVLLLEATRLLTMLCMSTACLPGLNSC